MSRKLPTDAFYAQFHNHEKHEDDGQYQRPFSHEVPHHPSAGPNPDYRRKKHHRHKMVEKAIQVTR